MSSAIGAAIGIGTFSAGALGATIGAAGSIGGALISSGGAQSAADTQASAANAGIAQQASEFNTIQGLLKPYVDLGTGAIPGYQNAMSDYGNALSGYQGIQTQLGNITGANGSAAQQQAISGLASNPLYTTSMQLGQQEILANASATGGLRGGNTIASLGYLPNQVLSNVMQTQIGNLGTALNGQAGLLNGINTGVTQQGNLINVGENAAAGTGQAAMSTGNNITNLTGQIGSAQAGATLAGTNATTSAINNIASSLGSYLNPSSGSSNYSFALPAYLNAAGLTSPTGIYMGA